MIEIENVSLDVLVWLELLVGVKRVCCEEVLFFLLVRQRKLAAMVHH